MVLIGLVSSLVCGVIAVLYRNSYLRSLAEQGRLERHLRVLDQELRERPVLRVHVQLPRATTIPKAPRYLSFSSGRV